MFVDKGKDKDLFAYRSLAPPFGFLTLPFWHLSPIHGWIPSENIAGGELKIQISMG